MTRKEIQGELRVQVVKCVQEANAYLIKTGKAPIKWPEVRFYERGTKAAVAYSSGRIDFNLTMCALNYSDFVQNIPAHEVAHLVAFHLGVTDLHGVMWKSICEYLGGDGEATNRYVNPGSVWYGCTCGMVLPYSRRRHFLATHGRQYRCPCCECVMSPASSNQTNEPVFEEGDQPCNESML